MTDAIVTDAEDTPEAPEPKLNTQHQTAFDALVARRQAESNPEPPIEDTQEPEPQVEPTIDLIDAQGNIVKVPASARYRAKVDGQDVEVPFEQITRSYQKGAAADQRLAEASKRQKDLETKERELEAKGAELTKKEQSFVEQMQKLDAKKDTGAVSEDDYRARAKKLLAALTDEDDPESALTEVLKGFSPQSVDADTIAARAKSETLAEIDKRNAEKAERERQKKAEAEQAEMVKSNQRFASEYADIVSDPIAYAAAKNLASSKWSAKPDAHPWEIASEVGTEIRAWMGSKVSKPKPPTTVPKSVSARASIGKDPEPVTRESTIAAMKKARGQPV